VTGVTAWALVGGCAAVTAAIKATGPVALGGRDLPDWVTGVIALMAPALLAALVATAALTHGSHLAVGPETAGVAVAAVLILRGGNVVAAVVVSAAVTALLRALGL
jgi:branched-subunit amino acid transport protein